MIKFKKIFYIFFFIFINYFLISAIVFSFSYISLINGKTYDWFWVKSIQKKIYFKGLRNIWQYDDKCSVYDISLLYKPKIGSCNFNNPEFKTKLNFDNYSRNHNIINDNTDSKEFLIVLGDSVGMGWGVNDNETFSYFLEKKINKKVYNMSVSSYGTVREIKRLKNSPYYNNSKTIIIQYHSNDLGENKSLDINKEYSKKEFENIFKNQKDHIKLNFLLGLYKTSLRLFFSDIIDFVFRERNLEIIDFSEDKVYLENVLKKNINLLEKRVIIILPVNPWQKILNFPIKSEGIEYLQIKLEGSDFFTIDDHPNSNGHKKIAFFIEQYLKKEFP